MESRESLINTLNQGGVIAYPTEGVYGLGCDPENEIAIQKLLDIKQRPWQKGLILIASDYEQLTPYLEQVTKEKLEHAMKTWPGPFTWIFPAKKSVSKFIRGEHASIAVRVTAHPIARLICESYGKAIISTSANIANQKPATTSVEVNDIFKDQLDLIIPGECGPLHGPTTIIDVLSGKKIR